MTGGTGAEFKGIGAGAEFMGIVEAEAERGALSRGNESMRFDDAAVRVETGSKAGAGTEGGEESVGEAGAGLGEEAATKVWKGLGANSVI